MEVFLVGGAIRDFLLAKMQGQLNSALEEQQYWSQVEKDWVVVGGTPQEMQQQGFYPVGKSFPVFLHPDTKDEYALARTERKIGKGYTGFECFTGTTVTLEDDLKRRDLTINALAARVDPATFHLIELIDPYHGVEDLSNKIFRHVSDAFAEDPVRILRLARFATRFSDFTVHPDTLQLMKKMVMEGEVDALIPERVWQEWCRSLTEKKPWRFFSILEACAAQESLFPGVLLTKTLQEKIELAANHHENDKVLLAIELSELAEAALQTLIMRYRIPNEYAELIMLVVKFGKTIGESLATPESILTLLEKTDAFRKGDRFAQFLVTCCYLGTISQRTNQQLIELLLALKNIDTAPFIDKGLQGLEIAKAIRQARLEKLSELLVKD